jgi:cell division septation protein DedD
LPRPAAPPKDAAAPPPIPGPFAFAPAAQPGAAATAPPAIERKTAAAPATTAGKPGAPVKPAPAKEASTKEAAAILEASTSASPKAATGGPVKVQLGSVRSAEAARDEWARLKREQPDLLGKLTAVAVRADLGDKGTYYRIQAGPLADGGAAERLCGELRQRKLGCTLVR